MENTNVTCDTQQTVVASATQSAGDSGILQGTPCENTDTEIAPRTQSRAENSGFRKLRLENEGYKKEIENLKSQLSRLSELEDVKKQNSLYLDRLVKDRMERDLEIIRKENPDINHLSMLGEQFIRLIESGVDAKTAYNASVKATDSKEMQSIPQIGRVGYSQGTPSRYFTSKELDRLTAKDLENPKIFKKAMESLKKL